MIYRSTLGLAYVSISLILQGRDKIYNHIYLLVSGFSLQWNWIKVESKIRTGCNLHLKKKTLAKIKSDLFDINGLIGVINYLFILPTRYLRIWFIHVWTWTFHWLYYHTYCIIHLIKSIKTHIAMANLRI